MTDPLRARNRLGVVFFPAFDWAISEIGRAHV